jgi:hypothetical protein
MGTSAARALPPGWPDHFRLEDLAGSWRSGATAFGEGDLTESNAALGRDLPGQQRRRTET